MSLQARHNDQMKILKIMEWSFRIPVFLTLCHQSIQQHSSDSNEDEPEPPTLPPFLKPYTLPSPHPLFNNNNPHILSSQQQYHPLFPSQLFHANAIIQPVPQSTPYYEEALGLPGRSLNELPFNPGSPPGIDNDKKKVWRFEVDVPKILQSLNKYFVHDKKSKGDGNGEIEQELRPNTRQNAEQGADYGEWTKGKLKFEVVQPKLYDIIKSVKDALESQNRRRHFYGSYVEEGPGAIKSETFKHPKGFLEGHLNYLMSLKKKRDKARALG